MMGSTRCASIFWIVGLLTPTIAEAQVLKTTVTLAPAHIRKTAPRCKRDMVEVEGNYCAGLSQQCLRWLDPQAKTKLQCAEFSPTPACLGKLIREHFCIDRYEWPNQKGELPLVAIDWHYAKKNCESQGKRLCIDREWTLACEGNERWPYPYGFTRNADACNIDKVWRKVDFDAYEDPKRRTEELKKLDQREPIGSHPSCISPFGAYDMAGNVDEWVINESGKPFKSGLKGGYWGPVRTRCRPMTTSHEETFHFYQIGFRCCSDLEK